MQERTNALPRTNNELIENEELRKRIAALNSEVAELQRDLASYIILVNEKDKWALELQRELNKYQRFPLIRLRACAARAVKKIYRGLKRVVKKFFA